MAVSKETFTPRKESAPVGDWTANAQLKTLGHNIPDLRQGPVGAAFANKEGIIKPDCVSVFGLDSVSVMIIECKNCAATLVVDDELVLLACLNTTTISCEIDSPAAKEPPCGHAALLRLG